MRPPHRMCRCRPTRPLSRHFLLQRRAIELELAAVFRDGDAYLPASGQASEKQLLGEWALDELLNDARHGTRTHLRVVALLGHPGACRIVERQVDAFLLELHLDF